jgi:hypothetical protein
MTEPVQTYLEILQYIDDNKLWDADPQVYPWIKQSFDEIISRSSTQDLQAIRNINNELNYRITQRIMNSYEYIPTSGQNVYINMVGKGYNMYWIMVMLIILLCFVILAWIIISISKPNKKTTTNSHDSIQLKSTSSS